jgi:hypothetical protein
LYRRSVKQTTGYNQHLANNKMSVADRDDYRQSTSSDIKPKPDGTFPLVLV